MFNDNSSDDDEPYTDSSSSSDEGDTTEFYALRRSSRIREMRRRKQDNMFSNDLHHVIPLPFKPTCWTELVCLCRKSKELPIFDYYKDCRILRNVEPIASEIDKLIGLEEVKETIANFIIAFCSNVTKKSRTMCHVVITGQSGTGKTTLARLLAKLFNALGLLSTDRVVVGNRVNMIGAHLGETSKMTQKRIDEAEGGCLLIDEAYQLGHRQGENDSYAQNCLDTLNQNLTEQGNNFQCIVVGYRHEMEYKFFAMNPGLRRRFQWVFHLPKMKAADLFRILEHMLVRQGLRISTTSWINVDWFHSKMKHFPHWGGSVENLVSKIFLTHSTRVFGASKDEKGIITKEDVNRGYEMYRKFDSSLGSQRAGNSFSHQSMYL